MSAVMKRSGAISGLLTAPVWNVLSADLWIERSGGDPVYDIRANLVSRCTAMRPVNSKNWLPLPVPLAWAIDLDVPLQWHSP